MTKAKNKFNSIIILSLLIISLSPIHLMGGGILDQETTKAIESSGETPDNHKLHPEYDDFNNPNEIITQESSSQVTNEQNNDPQNAENDVNEYDPIYHEEYFDNKQSRIVVETRTHQFEDVATIVSVLRHNFETNEFELYSSSESAGHTEIMVPDGQYKVIAEADNTISSSQFRLNYKQSENIEFIFSKVKLTGYSLVDQPRNVDIALYDGDEEIKSIFEFGYQDSIELFLEPQTYQMQVDGKVKTLDAIVSGSHPILLPDQQIVANGIELSNSASFGQLSVSITSADGFPVSGITVDVYNSSSGIELFDGTTNSEGIFSEEINPIDYDVKITASSIELWNYSVSVSGGQETVVDFELARILYYAGEDSWVHLTNPTDTLTYAFFRTYGPRAIFYTPTGYDFRIEGDPVSSGPPTETFTGINVTQITTYEVGDRIEYTPYFTSVTHQGRITANQSTDITIRLRDNNFDFPLQLDFKPLHGSVTTNTITWINDPILGTTVTFDAPTYDDFYQLDFAVVDQSGYYTNHTLYLSDRSSTVTFNATGVNDRPLDTYIETRRTFDDSHYSSVRTYGDGEATISVPDGRYYFIWRQDVYHFSDTSKIDANIGTFYFNYSFTELTINTTMHYGKSFGGIIELYNATTGIELDQKNTDTSTGLVGFVVPAYVNYTIQAFEYRESSLFAREFETFAGEEMQLDFEFGLIGVYTYDGDTPLDRYTYLYNGTTMDQITSIRTYGDGRANYIVAPYSNYTIGVANSPTYYIYNISVNPSEAVAVGDFVNTAPTLNSISASPSRINANESTIISISANEVDPVDNLDYTWTANVGSITGTGSSINYTAPTYNTYYRIDVNVSDQFGGWINTFIVVSNQFSTVTVNITVGDGTPFDSYVYFEPTRPNVSSTPSTLSYRTYGDGLVTISNLIDNEYTIYVDETNRISYHYLINQSNLYLNYSFAEVLVNASSYNGNPLNVLSQVYYNDTGTQVYSSWTSTDGLITYYLRPGTYDFSATVSGSTIWEYDYELTANQDITVDFKFGQLYINFTKAGNNPHDGWTYLYNPSQSGSSISSSRTYSDGITSFAVAPGQNYSVRFAGYPDYTIYNLSAGANDRTYVNLEMAVVQAYVFTDGNPESQLFRIFYANSSTYFLSANTGADGFYRGHITPGTYDISLNSILYEDVIVNSGDVLNFGNEQNFAPDIQAISSSPTDVSADQTTTVSLDVWDTNYEFENLTLTVETSVGSVTYDVFNGFVSEDEYRMRFNFTAPSTLQTYILNITISDQQGGEDTYNYVISDQDNTVNFESLKGELAPENTWVRVWDVQSGDSVYSAYTSASTGILSITLKDGYYNIRFAEDNDIWFTEIWIIGGDTYNFTAEFGEVDIYATGVGGIPIDTWIEVYNNDNDEYIVSRRTYGDGLATFILNPGNYRFEVQGTVDIILFGQVSGGQYQILGSEVPDLNNNPELLTYFYGQTNQTITWEFSDNNPTVYNVTVDGMEWKSGIWDGNSVTIDFSGLDLGTYEIRIEVYDEFDYYNFDVATVEVISPAAPTVSELSDRSLFFNGSTVLEWQVTSIIGDNYTILLNGALFTQGLWSNGTIVGFVNNYLEGVYNFTITIEDELGRQANDTVIITVGADPVPQLTIDNDFSIDYGFTKVGINYTITDNNIDYYEAYLDGILIATSSVSTGDRVYMLSSLDVGLYNFSIIVYDGSAQATMASVMITVTDGETPLVSNIGDLTIEFGQSVDSLNWTIQDTTETTFEILLNGSIIDQGTVTSGFHSYTPDFSALGAYNITLIVTDSNNNFVVKQLMISIIDTTSPIVVASQDQTIIEGESLESLEFTITDLDDTVSFLLLDNHELSRYTNITSLSYNHDDILAAGIYNFTLLVIDSSGNEASVSLFVEVLQDQPSFMEAPDDQVLSPTTLSTTELNWSAMSNLPGIYEIRVNGSVIDTGLWINGSMYSIDLTGFEDANLLNIEIWINNTLGADEIHEFNVFIVTEEVENFLSNLSNTQLIFILISMITILGAIIRRGPRGNTYGRVF